MSCKYCNDDFDFKVRVADIETKCKYHKEIGAVYMASAIVPKGMCQELFHTIYPECLAVLYSGLPIRGRLRQEGVVEYVVNCPAPNGVKVLIKSEEIFPTPLRKLKEFVEECCKTVYKAFDAPYRKVLIEVLETGIGCHKGYNIGDIFQFNINKKDELCPAGFAAIYPYLRLVKNINRSSQGASLLVHCPDYVGVTYEVIPG